MRVLMLSWEYPPRVVGGLSRHVQELGRAMAPEHDVEVITMGDSNSVEVDHGVRVHRVQVPGPQTDDFLQWASQLAMGMLARGARLINETGPFDIVHAHDWTSAFPGVGMKHAFDLPLIATIHATEFGRNSGLHTPLQRRISDIEWYLGYEAWNVIVCSEHMRKELMSVFGMPGDKLRVIPNGVVSAQFRKGHASSLEALGFAAEDEVIMFVGRLVHEKGVQVLVEAMPFVLAARPRARLAIIGTGPFSDEVRRLIDHHGLQGYVRMLGFVSDDQRNAVYGRAMVAVVPSLYEPFGITALEAMAAGVPLVASAVGGLQEIVEHGRNGLLAQAGDARQLAAAILAVLSDGKLRQVLTQAASHDIRTIYDWRAIARRTAEAYSEVLGAARDRAIAQPGFSLAPAAPAGPAGPAGQVGQPCQVGQAMSTAYAGYTGSSGSTRPLERASVVVGRAATAQRGGREPASEVTYR
jgi:glycogen(starch) synthase